MMNLTRKEMHLLIAVENNDADKIRELHAEGVDLDVGYDFGSPGLFKACDEGKWQAARALLELGADIHFEKEGKTAFTRVMANLPNRWFKLPADACPVKDNAVLLVQKGACLTTCDSNGFLPLHQALLAGHFELAQAMIDRGADVDALNQNGRTGLTMIHHVAMSAARKKVISFLISNDADPEYRDRHGQTVFDVLMERPQMVDLIDHVETEMLKHDIVKSQRCMKIKAPLKVQKLKPINRRQM